MVRLRVSGSLQSIPCGVVLVGVSGFGVAFSWHIVNSGVAIVTERWFICEEIFSCYLIKHELIERV